MKQNAKLLIFIILFAICACSTPSINSNVPSESVPADAIFYSAENLFEANSHEIALKTYKQYLDLYPHGSKADLALMRIATIYSEQKNQDAKLMAYRRLITQHPDSPFVADAMVEILVYLYNEGKFKEVILQASEIIEKTDSTTRLFRTYAILGDTYVSLGFPRDAIFFYHIAYQNARSPEEKNILFKLKTIVSQFSAEDTLSLLMRLDDEFLRSYLLYQLGVNRYENQNYKEASKIFSEFIENFPDHEKANQAKNLIEEINQKFAFERRLIGGLLPLSGPYETFGRRALRGFQFALDQFNSQSNQPAFEMIVKDTGSVPEIAIQSFRQLDENRVAIIIGPIITGEYAAQEAQIKGIPIITLTQKPGIPELGDYVFRIFLTSQMQIDAIVPYVIDQLGLGRFAVLYPQDHYGTTFMELFRDKVLDYGATVVAIESYKPDQTDFALQIKKLSKTFNDHQDSVANYSQQSSFRGKNRHIKSEVIVDFDAIFIPDVPEKIALIAPQLIFYDIDDVLLLGTNLWHSDKLIQMAREYIQEAIMADVFYAEDSKKNVKEFIMSFENLYGQSPGFIEALAYDAAMIAFQAASNPRVESRKDLKNELQNLRNFAGVTGLTSFKENGDAVKKLYLLQVQDNKFVELNGN
jgi:ABC-type branched-subunit amino acid transport system substrate-binding protein/predicted negative regulator of RcsB-dependent stress response